MEEALRWSLTAALLAISVLSAGHALTHKRDPRAAAGWVAVCLFFPAFGPFAYWLLGVNRIRTRGRELSLRWPIPLDVRHERVQGVERIDGPPAPTVRGRWDRMGRRVTGRALLEGNRVEALHDGQQAFPAMLEAIEGARESVHLSTYIFDVDETGERFVAALGAARTRGLDVRVLVDGVGHWLSRGSARRALQRAGVPVARFLPPRLIPPAFYFNLRNHRKLLVVDGEVGFTGGMNVSRRHRTDRTDGGALVHDVHFRVRGPVVEHLAFPFLEDWCFATGEPPPEQVVREHEHAGEALCRGIVDGPNEDLDRLKWILLAGIAGAQERVRLMTPYFVPDRELIIALNTAALRGIAVDVVIPEKLDHPWMSWATHSLLWELVAHGVRVHLRPPPFAHTKLALFDEEVALVGSANLDARSLRLNFEFNLEVHESEVCRGLIEHFDQVRDLSRRTDLAELDGRSLPVKLRDATAWLFSPYL